MDAEPTSELVAKVDALSFTERWALTSVLLLRLEQSCESDMPDERAMRRVDRTMQFYRATMDGEPQNEFLLNGITNCDAVAMRIARAGSEQYRESAERVFFTDTAPVSENDHSVSCLKPADLEPVTSTAKRTTFPFTTAGCAW